MIILLIGRHSHPIVHPQKSDRMAMPSDQQKAKGLVGHSANLHQSPFLHILLQDGGNLIHF